MRRVLIMLLCVFAGAGTLVAQDEAPIKENPPEPGAEVVQQATKVAQQDREIRSKKEALSKISTFLKLVGEEEKAGHLTADRAQQMRSIAVELSVPYGTYTDKELAAFAAGTRMVSTTKVLAILASILTALALVIAIGLFFKSIEAVEFIGFSVGLAMMAGLVPDLGVSSYAWAFCGAVICSITLVTSKRHFKVPAGTLDTVLMVVWGMLALTYRDQYTGFVATACLISLLGFAVVPFGFGYVVGWKDKEAVKRCLIVCLFVLGLGMVATKAPLESPLVDWAVQPFLTGFLVLGSLVSLIGYLCLASKYGCNESGEWAFMNVVFMTLCLGLILAGSAFSIPYVTGIALTIGFFWILDKLFEVDLGGWGWVMKFAFGAAICYLVINYLRAHPELFL